LKLNFKISNFLTAKMYLKITQQQQVLHSARGPDKKAAAAAADLFSEEKNPHHDPSASAKAISDENHPPI
jgi:hypothetical protein